MPNFDKIVERLHKLESLRLEPVDSDLLENALETINWETPIQSIEESFDSLFKSLLSLTRKFTAKRTTVSPYTYGDYYVQSPELIDLINSLPFNLQQSLPTLRKQKKSIKPLFTARLKVNLSLSKRMIWITTCQEATTSLMRESLTSKLFPVRF